MAVDIEAYRNQMKGRKIMVVGMGRSGMAAVKELHALGAVVTAQDIHTLEELDPRFAKYMEREQIDAVLGGNPEDPTGYDMIVLSPGVAPNLPFLEAARSAGVEVIGELEMAYRLTHGKFVAITGTNGKTTTTTLVGKIFEAAGRKKEVIGNIGVAAISKASDSTDDEWLITEASSFQLETTVTFAPVIAAVLNLTPDHLNRHKTMAAYAEAKQMVTANQTEEDYLVFNLDDRACDMIAMKTHAKKIPFSRKQELTVGAYLKDDCLVVKDEEGVVHPICKKDELLIIGDHNVENALAAAAIAYFAGIDPETIGKAVKAFPGVEHRIEYCGAVDGVSYYNDSKGTNVDAALIALRALKDHILLIAGGDGKAQDFADLGKALPGRVKELILFGRDAKEIGKAAEAAGFTAITYEKDLHGCVLAAAAKAEAGDKVLLSPACASWDMYDNYEQRGDHFKSCVQQMLR